MATNATFSIVPETLDLAICKGDEFGMAISFEDANGVLDLTGYTFSASVFATNRSVTSSHPGGIYTRGADATAFVITVVSAASGEINLALSESQTNSLDETATYRWALVGVRPGTITRTYLSGNFTVQSP